MMADLDTQLHTFEQLRSTLFALVYRMLGSAMDADDIYGVLNPDKLRRAQHVAKEESYDPAH